DLAETPGAATLPVVACTLRHRRRLFTLDGAATILTTAILPSPRWRRRCVQTTVAIDLHQQISSGYRSDRRPATHPSATLIGDGYQRRSRRAATSSTAPESGERTNEKRQWLSNLPWICSELRGFEASSTKAYVGLSWRRSHPWRQYGVHHQPNLKRRSPMMHLPGTVTLLECWAFSSGRARLPPHDAVNINSLSLRYRPPRRAS
ncbi:Os01g0313600, partial [Oryza sativa Japonica Group]